MVAEKLLYDAEVHFRNAVEPGLSKDYAASLVAAGQKALAASIEFEDYTKRTIAHARRSKTNAEQKEPFRSAKLRALTPREFAIFSEVTSGASSKQIARNLNISPRTVDAHRANILRKLGAKSTVDLLRIVMTERAE